MSGLTTNAAYQQRQREREKLGTRQEDVDLRATMSSPQGRRMVWHFITTRCSLFQETPAGNDGLMMTARQNLAKRLLADLVRVDAHAHRAMWTEGWATRAEDELHAKDAALFPKQEQEE